MGINIQITADDKESFGLVFDFLKSMSTDSIKRRIESAEVITAIDSSKTVEFVLCGSIISTEFLPSNHTVIGVNTREGNLTIKCKVEGFIYPVVYTVDLQVKIEIRVSSRVN